MGEKRPIEKITGLINHNPIMPKISKDVLSKVFYMRSNPLRPVLPKNTEEQIVDTSENHGIICTHSDSDSGNGGISSLISPTVHRAPDQKVSNGNQEISISTDLDQSLDLRIDLKYTSKWFILGNARYKIALRVRLCPETQIFIIFFLS
jgi:hypothetical protein